MDYLELGLHVAIATIFIEIVFSQTTKDYIHHLWRYFNIKCVVPAIRNVQHWINDIMDPLDVDSGFYEEDEVVQLTDKDE